MLQAIHYKENASSCSTRLREIHVVLISIVVYTLFIALMQA